MTTPEENRLQNLETAKERLRGTAFHEHISSTNSRLNRHIDRVWPRGAFGKTITDPLVERVLDARELTGEEKEAERLAQRPNVESEVLRSIIQVLRSPVDTETLTYTPTSTSDEIVELMSHFIEHAKPDPVPTYHSERDRFLKQALLLQRYVETNISLKDKNNEDISLFIPLKQIEDIVLTHNILNGAVESSYAQLESGISAESILLRSEEYQNLTAEDRKRVLDKLKTAIAKRLVDQSFTPGTFLNTTFTELKLDAELMKLSSDTMDEYLKEARAAVQKLQDKINSIPDPTVAPLSPVYMLNNGVPEQKAIIDAVYEIKSFITNPNVIAFQSLDATTCTFDDILDPALDLAAISTALDTLTTSTAVLDSIPTVADALVSEADLKKMDRYIGKLDDAQIAELGSKLKAFTFSDPSVGWNLPTSLEDFSKYLIQNSDVDDSYQLLGLDQTKKKKSIKIGILYLVWKKLGWKQARKDFEKATKSYLFPESKIHEFKDELNKTHQVPATSEHERQKDAMVAYLEAELATKEKALNVERVALASETEKGANIRILQPLMDSIKRLEEESAKLQQTIRILKNANLTVNTLDAIDDIDDGFTPAERISVKKKAEQWIHTNVEDEVRETLTTLKQEVVPEPNDEARSLNAFVTELAMDTVKFSSPEEAEKIISHYLKKLRDIHGNPANLPENISLQPGAMFHLRGTLEKGKKVDTFVKLKAIHQRVVEFEGSYNTEPFHTDINKLAGLLLTPPNASGSKIDYVMQTSDNTPPLRSVKDLTKAIAEHSSRRTVHNKKSDKSDKDKDFTTTGLQAGLAPGVEITFGKEPDLDKGEKPFAKITSIDEGKRQIKTDKGQTISFDEFYLLATHRDANNAGTLMNTRHLSDASPEYLEKRVRAEGKGIKNKKPAYNRISPHALFNLGKAYIEEIGNERKRKKEMRTLIAQIKLLKPGNRVRERARQSYFSKENEKMDGLKAELDILDNDAMRVKVAKFMKEVRPGNPHIHKNDGMVFMQGKLMPAFDARTKIKNMFIYLLERYGTAYPFAETEQFKHEKYWLHVFAESETVRQHAIEKAKSYTDEYNKELEIWQLHSLFRLQGDFYGYEFASKTENAHEKGNSNEANLKEKQAKSTTKTGDLVGQLVGYIEDGRWDGIQILFATLTEKGLSSEDMFNLFLRMYYKMTFEKKGHKIQYRSEHARDQVQKIAKAVFPKYPELYFFMFRNEDTYNKFGSILYNEAGWDAGWKKPDKKNPILKPSVDLYRKFTLDGDYTLLNGFASKRSRYIETVREVRDGYVLSFDPTHDANMWKKNPLLTASKAIFNLAKDNYDISGFKNAHWSNYMAELIKQVGHLNNSNLNALDREAYMDYIRKEFYQGMYSQVLNGNSPADVREQYAKLNDHKSDKDQQAYYMMSNKKSVRTANNFLKQYEEDLNEIGLSYNECLRAAGI